MTEWQGAKIDYINEGGGANRKTPNLGGGQIFNATRYLNERCNSTGVALLSQSTLLIPLELTPLERLKK